MASTSPQPSDRNPHRVFGYGSLLDPDSIGRTLERSMSQEDIVPASLAGYVRRWNVASDQSTVSRGYVDGSGERWLGHIVFLGIEPMPGGTVPGGLVAVSDAELGRLDRRERNYDRIIVEVELADGSSVEAQTYLPSDPAKPPFDPATTVVRADYVELVDHALARLYPDYTLGTVYDELPAGAPTAELALRQAAN
ncbi:MAG: gamma-glutamylcyclotransferase family protein [Acidimicrobiales bacterium]